MVHFTPVDPCFPGPLSAKVAKQGICCTLQEWCGIKPWLYGHRVKLTTHSVLLFSFLLFLYPENTMTVTVKHGTLIRTRSSSNSLIRIFKPLVVSK